MIMNQIKCIIVAMDVEFLAIIERFNQECFHVYKLEDKYPIAECYKRKLIIAQSGIGKASAKGCVSAIYKQYPQILSYISAGTSGALFEELNVGDIIIGNSIIEKRHEEWSSIQIADDIIQYMAKQDTRCGSILCSDEFIYKTEDKQALHSKTEAICVDMESSCIAQFAQDTGVSFAAIKIISDHANEKSIRSFIRMHKTVCDKLAIYLYDVIKKLQWRNP